MSTEICTCPHCGASMKMRWHRLSAGLVYILIKFKKRIIALDRNKIHTMTDIDFSKNEYNNFQKLRYHGLVAKYRDENGKHESGYWVLTSRGNKFLKGQISVPQNVQTFRNKITNISEERVFISTVLNDQENPYFDQYFDFDYKEIDDCGLLELENKKQSEIIGTPDGNGQVTLFN